MPYLSRLGFGVTFAHDGPVTGSAHLAGDVSSVADLDHVAVATRLGHGVGIQVCFAGHTGSFLVWLIAGSSWVLRHGRPSLVVVYSTGKPCDREERNTMLLSERRKRYRQVLEGNVCVHPASVFDAMSARMAQSLGFEVGMFAGSIGSGTVLGAPDLVVLTLTEFADQIHRIARGSDLPLMVDADHGYGNALNVMRTVEELETSGVAALTIEDTVLPIPFGGHGEDLV